VPARKSSPKGWVGWDKKKSPSKFFRAFLNRFVKDLSEERIWAGSKVRKTS
jgi:hypothetical protein